MYIICKKNIINNKISVLTTENIFVEINGDEKQHVCQGFTDYEEAQLMKMKYDKEYPYDVVVIGVYGKGLLDQSKAYMDYVRKSVSSNIK